MVLTAVLLTAMVNLPAIDVGDDTAYVADMNAWRKGQEADLLAPEGWLSVAGLDWLSEGGNPLILDLPSQTKVGTVTCNGAQISLSLLDGFVGDIAGQPFTPGVIRADVDRIKISSTADPNRTVTIVVIHRGRRTGVRIFDQNCEGRKEFTGMKWFAVKTAYKIKALFTAYPASRQLPITNIIGDTAMVTNPGYVTFNLRGKPCRLEAEAQGSTLFFNFLDATSGKETYPAGRFLYADGPINGVVTLDFNKAVNPPCAFTNFATCPLPPQANCLLVRIPAGEKVHHPPETQ